jgi:chemotaxis protein CheX
MTTAYPLPAILDTAAAGPLRAALLARIETGMPVLVNGSGVTRVGLACLQVLASARITAEAAALRYRMDSPSAALRDMAVLARLDVALDPVA